MGLIWRMILVCVHAGLWQEPHGNWTLLQATCEVTLEPAVPQSSYKDCSWVWGKWDCAPPCDWHQPLVGCWVSLKGENAQTSRSKCKCGFGSMVWHWWRSIQMIGESIAGEKKTKRGRLTQPVLFWWKLLNVDLWFYVNMHIKTMLTFKAMSLVNYCCCCLKCMGLRAAENTVSPQDWECTMETNSTLAK